MVWARRDNITFKYRMPSPGILNNINSAYWWCKNHQSIGKFHHTMLYWYFEVEEDALLFTLKWG